MLAMQSLFNGLKTLSRASSSRAYLRPSTFTASYPRRFYSENRDDDADEDTASLFRKPENLRGADEGVIFELLAGDKIFVPPESKPAPLPTPHAFPSRNKVSDSQILEEEDGPPVGPPGTEPKSPPGQTAKLSPWDQRREEARSGKAAKKTSEVLNASKSANYRLYVNAGRNNCILTLINEEGKVRGRMSAGMCGFRNSQESTYEAGYQCAVRMFDIIRNQVVERTDKTMKLEIFLKGFGQSRQALLKALTMTEGNGVRELVTRLTDNTPLKIGGVREQKARRM